MKVTTPAYYYLFANNILIDWIWNQYNWIGKTPLWHNLFYREPTLTKLLFAVIPGLGLVGLGDKQV